MRETVWLAQLLSEFETRKIMDECFPMLTRFGLTDTDVAIHSHMLSYLAYVGQCLGFSGIAECPLPPPRDSRMAMLGEVRADVLWFDKQSNQPVASFEFERYQTRNDEIQLRYKIENLAITFLRSGGSIQHSFLVYWLRSGKAPKSFREPQAFYRSGFVRNGVRVPPPDCPLTLAKCVFTSSGEGLIVRDILLVNTATSLPE